jgi:hypothetical protein
VNEEILEGDEYLGLCTVIEITKSRLFSVGCEVAAELMRDDDLWFSACVPSINARLYSQLLSLVENSAGQIALAYREATPILIQIKRTEGFLALDAERQAKLASVLVNRFLRAYEHTYFDLFVPRHRLDGRSIVLLTPQGTVSLKYTPVTLEMDDVLDEYLPSHVDAERIYLESMMGAPETITPSWRIVVDGARHFEGGNLRETVLCACSAAEIIASPAVERWLRKNTLEGGGGAVRTAVREMGNPLRFDLCISGACTSAFEDIGADGRAELSAALRRMNSLRNAVVHRGEEPESAAAAEAIHAAAKFVCKMWLANMGGGGASA